MNQKTKDILDKIGRCFLTICEGDKQRASDLLHKLAISDIQMDDDSGRLSVTVGRPGLFIGKRGANIDMLLLYLKDFGVMKINLIEQKECVIDYLLGFMYDDWEIEERERDDYRRLDAIIESYDDDRR